MKNININYGGLMGSYDIVMASIVAYSTVFLISKGLDEFSIGVVISVANLLAAIIQPWLGDKVDKSLKLNLFTANLLIVLPGIGLLIGILLFQRMILLITVMYMFAVTLQVTLQPFMNAIGVLLINRGYKVNFGACRAAESLSFAITSSILGVLINRFGTNTIIVMALIGFVVYLLLLLLLNKRFLTEIFQAHADNIKLNTTDVALTPSRMPFFQKYPHFKYVLFGSCCFFIGYNYINLFMIQIITNVGGDTANMGVAIALAAMVETPVMFFFNRINKRFSSRNILLFTSVFFFVKALVTFLSSDVTGIYLAQLIQALSFGLYIVASVYYTNEVIEDEDKVKGQALIATAHTIGGIIGSSVGGWIINVYSVRAGLLFIIIMSLFGIASYYIGLVYMRNKYKTI